MVTWRWRSKVKVMSRMGVKYQKLSFLTIYIHYKDQIMLPTPRLWSMGNPMVAWCWRSKVKVMSKMWVKYRKSWFFAIYKHYRDQIVFPTPRLLICKSRRVCKLYKTGAAVRPAVRLSVRPSVRPVELLLDRWRDLDETWHGFRVSPWDVHECFEIFDFARNLPEIWDFW